MLRATRLWRGQFGEDWVGSSRVALHDEAFPEYSPWLGMEHYHDATTGENYWVSPSRDWNETGPQGPGYYTKVGNGIRKLESGLSQ
jgi:hypothetical protein